MKLRRLLPRVRAATFLELMLSLIIAQLVGASVAVLKHHPATSGSDAGVGCWSIVFGIWALLLYTQE